MKLHNLVAWRKFTYSQLYPAVLGSMLYGVLHWSERSLVQELVAVSVTGLLVIDYLHLYEDLKAPESARGWETVLDAAFAVLLGIAFWQIDDGVFTSAAAWLGATIAVLVIYSLIRGGYSGVKMGVLAAMLLCTGVMFWFAWSRTSELFVAAAAIIMTLIYGRYVFTWQVTPETDKAAVERSVT